MEYSTTGSAFGSFLERTSSTEWLADLNARCLWKLSLDEENNSILREEFFYEQVLNASGPYYDSLVIPIVEAENPVSFLVLNHY